MTRKTSIWNYLTPDEITEIADIENEEEVEETEMDREAERRWNEYEFDIFVKMKDASGGELVTYCLSILIKQFENIEYDVRDLKAAKQGAYHEDVIDYFLKLMDSTTRGGDMAGYHFSPNERETRYQERIMDVMPKIEFISKYKYKIIDSPISRAQNNNIVRTIRYLADNRISGIINMTSIPIPEDLKEGIFDYGMGVYYVAIPHGRYKLTSKGVKIVRELYPIFGKLEVLFISLEEAVAKFRAISDSVLPKGPGIPSRSAEPIRSASFTEKK